MSHLGTAEYRILLAASQAFSLNFSDPLNAPAAEYDIPVDPDGKYEVLSRESSLPNHCLLVTFLKIALDDATIVWQADNVAVEIRLPHGLRMDSNDLAGKLYSKVTSLRIPEVSMKMLLSKANCSEWHEAADLVLDAYLDNYAAPVGWRERAQAQAEFLAKQDGHTCRALFLYMPDQSVPNDTLAPGS